MALETANPTSRDTSSATYYWELNPASTQYTGYLVNGINTWANYVQAPDTGPVADTINGNDKNDRLFASIGDDVLHGYGGDDLVVGGDGNDWLTGDDQNDTLYGDYSNQYDTTAGIYPVAWTVPSQANVALSGNDHLDGGNGADILYGGPGNDQLYGGPRGKGWTDKLTGGDGADIFYLSYEMAETDSDSEEVQWWQEWFESVVANTGKSAVKETLEKLTEAAAKEVFETVAGGFVIGAAIDAVADLAKIGLQSLFEKSPPAPPPPTTEDVMVITEFDPRVDVLFLPTEENKSLIADVSFYASAAVSGLSGWGAKFQDIDGKVFAEVFLDQEFLSEFNVKQSDAASLAFLDNLFNTSLVVISGTDPDTGGIQNADSVYPFPDDPSQYSDGQVPEGVAETLALSAPAGTSTVLVGAFAPLVVYKPNVASGTVYVSGSNMGDILSVNANGFAPAEYQTQQLNVLPSLVKGFDGDDILVGGAGQDKLYGGDGDDDLYAFETLATSSVLLTESLYGGAGDDVLFVGGTAALVDGGDDIDTASFALSPYAVIADLSAGTARDTGTNGAGVAPGPNNIYTLVNVENLIGTNQKDTLTGGDGDNTLQGHMGDDVIVGGGGDDLLISGPYQPVLYRVAAGGPTAASTDIGPDWGRDTSASPSDYLLPNGALVQSTSATILYDSLTLEGAPQDVFTRFRYADASSNGTMYWQFPTYRPGTYTVNLYLMEGDSAITQANQRVFNVYVENVLPTVFTDIDPWVLGGSGNGGAGNQAFLLSYDVQVTDGELDLEFFRKFGDPSVHAIEIIYHATDNDTLDGGDGADTVSYNGVWGKVDVDLAVGTAKEYGKAGTGDADTVVFVDLLDSIENATGSSFDDALTGDDGDNILAGGAGNNVLVGGGGLDTVSFAGGATGLVIDMSIWSTTGATQVANSYGGTDTITGFINIIGGEGDDTITGDDRNNVLSGRAGKDTIAGSSGYDIVDFVDGNQGVRVDLWHSNGADRTGLWIDSFGDADTIDRYTVEAYRGTSFDDEMTGDGGGRMSALTQAIFFGDAGDDTLTGSGLDDQLNGGEDDDILVGLAGDDTLNGDDGDDVIKAAGNMAQVLYQINGGGPAVNSWTQDTKGSPNSALQPGATTFISTTTATVIYDAALLNDAPASIFDDARASNGNMNWEIPLYGSGNYPDPAGVGRYTVNLYIVEGYYLFNAAGERVFDVSVEGVVPAEFNDIDPWVLGGSGNGGKGNKAFVLSYEAVVTDGALSLEFISGVNNPIIYGIEVIQRSTDNDKIDGGAGVDTVDYSDNLGNVDVDLATGTAEHFQLSGKIGAIDMLSNIEAAVGSVYADTLTGDDNDNILAGNLGDDIIDGGKGNDIADYSERSAGINLTLSAPDASGERTTTLRDYANYNKVFETDALKSIEGVSGTNHNDDLTGSSADDKLSGGDGNDYLWGNEGKDILQGGDGDDHLFGGTNGVVLRVNAAQPHNSNFDHTIKAVDGGPDWTFDPYWITDSDEHGYDSAATLLYDRIDETVYPTELFAEEIWGSAGNSPSGGTLKWQLPVAEGYYLVDFLIVEGVPGNPPPTRVFSISVEGQLPAAVQNINPYAIGGNGNSGKGNEAFILTTDHSVFVSDGFLTLHFTASADNPKINAIQIRGWNTTADDDDILKGEDGDDWLAGYDGNDNLDGGTGTDWVNYEFNKGKVVVDLQNEFGQEYGAAGSADANTVLYTDQLTSIENVQGSFYSDMLSGDDNDNILDGRGGGDELRGNAGRDTFVGLAVDMIDDVIVDLEDGEHIEIGGNQGELALASAGLGGAHALEMFLDADGDGSSEGSLKVSGDFSARELDRLVVERQVDQSLHLTLREAYSSEVILDGGNGTKGDDLLYGSSEGDVINGRSGDDVVDGNAGDDLLDGGSGDDIIRGEDGDDAIRAGSGDDLATGGRGDDEIKGGSGDDWLDGGDDDDRIDGGSGDDTLKGQSGDDRLSGQAGDDRQGGGDGADRVAGGSGDDVLGGGTGRDLIQGGTGADVLKGGRGSDDLSGGGGSDTMTGGRGADTFRFGHGRDTVTDFEDDVDTLALDSTLWEGTLSKREVLNTYAQAGDDRVVFTFGDDARLVVDGIDSVDALRNDLDIV